MAQEDIRTEPDMNASPKPQTYNGDFTSPPPSLEPLTKERRWVVWRWTWVVNKSGGEKYTKPPFQPAFPNRYARSTDPSTWGTYQEACAAVAAGQADGIGFALLGSGVGAADLDQCRNPITGEIQPWADQIQAEADGAYREVTVSGTGLRVIGAVNGPKVHKKFNFRP
jgi:primase-polymerase (primpol)-like protein